MPDSKAPVAIEEEDGEEEVGGCGVENMYSADGKKSTAPQNMQYTTV